MSLVQIDRESYIKKGKKLLPKDKWADWEKTVYERVSIPIDGLEIIDFLKIQQILVKKEKGAWEDVKILVDSQRHTGASWNIICRLISSFCENGFDLVEYLNMD